MRQAQNRPRGWSVSGKQGLSARRNPGFFERTEICAKVKSEEIIGALWALAAKFCALDSIFSGWGWFFSAMAAFDVFCSLKMAHKELKADGRIP